MDSNLLFAIIAFVISFTLICLAIATLIVGVYVLCLWTMKEFWKLYEQNKTAGADSSG